MKLRTKVVLAMVAAVAVLIATVLGANALLADDAPGDPAEERAVADPALHRLVELSRSKAGGGSGGDVTQFEVPDTQESRTEESDPGNTVILTSDDSLTDLERSRKITSP